MRITTSAFNPNVEDFIKKRVSFNSLSYQDYFIISKDKKQIIKGQVILGEKFKKESIKNFALNMKRDARLDTEEDFGELSKMRMI